ncbi:probable xyloglucan endotransglucosylase/hydrolase protein 8 [Cryptomeria japonica]|uniref:probable xyloglucan endotransglucosylase/hydrolase protein 8 n=1 Tax=Cryptomeria japonica TaxID=3369 RepID=UPI0025AD0FE8|nr:probable xyloglucan endotransglucosylase/hydrolase protein 8 [Cryptomeria japonica]
MATSMKMGLGVVFLLVLSSVSSVICENDDGADKKFDDNFNVMWAEDHVKTSENGHVWHLNLDQISGSGFQSKHKYRFGWFSMKLKLVPGDSAGVVTAYYMSSNNDMNRDELDFEFLGNRSGQPYALQTNIYAKGVGGREQRHILWFDPTQEFHTYSILWNSHQIVFFVDQIPVRVHRHTRATTHVFPREQGMYLFSSIWNADDWATRGGLEKTNWAAAPFVSSYKKFHDLGCKWEDSFPACVATSTEKWWDDPVAWSLNEKQKEDYRWVRSKYMVYDYCSDKSRFSTQPVECSVAPWD